MKIIVKNGNLNFQTFDNAAGATRIVNEYATAIGTTQYNTELYNLVFGLLELGVWDNIEGIYPMLGSWTSATNNTKGINLVDTTKLQLKFRANVSNVSGGGISASKDTAIGDMPEFETIAFALNNAAFYISHETTQSSIYPFLTVFQNNSQLSGHHVKVGYRNDANKYLGTTTSGVGNSVSAWTGNSTIKKGLIHLGTGASSNVKVYADGTQVKATATSNAWELNQYWRTVIGAVGDDATPTLADGTLKIMALMHIDDTKSAQVCKLFDNFVEAVYQ